MLCPVCALPLAESTEACACGHRLAVAVAGPEAASTVEAPALAAPPREATQKLRAAKPATRRTTHRLNFHGTGGALLGMHIVNYFLTIFTLGIYSFWAKARVRRYMASQLEFQGQRFAYHGTGKEAFLGAIKVLGLFIGVFAVVALLAQLPGGEALGMLVAVAANLVLLPFAVVGGRKYFLSRTSLNGIRFSFRGDVTEFVKLFVPGALLTGLTLGLYAPFFEAKLRNYLLSHTYFGSRAFASSAEGRPLFKDHVIALVLHIPTFGLIWCWNMAKKERYYAEKTTFGKARFASDITGTQLFVHWLVNGLLLMLTFGIAYPWVMVRNVKFQLDHLVLRGEVDLAAIKQEAQRAGAMGEELGEALDVDMGIGLGI